MGRGAGSALTRIEVALAGMSDDAKAMFHEHLLGGTSADWLSEVLAEAGTPVSATMIKKYRTTVRKRAEAP